MISQDNVGLRYEFISNKYNNPKWFKLIYPESRFKHLWDNLMMFLVIYTVMYAPYRTAFMSYSSSDILFLFETVTDLLLFIDIFITLLTPFERVDGSLECNHLKIRANYIFGAFLFDIIAILPTQIFEKLFEGTMPSLDFSHQ